MKPLIPRQLSRHILFLGVSRKSKGGMTSVLRSYDTYIERMRFIPTWNLGNKAVKACYAASAIMRMATLLTLDRRIRIVHIHGAANASFYRCRIFINLAKALGRKVILHEHAADFKIFHDTAPDQNGITSTLNRCDRLIVLSDYWRQYFTSIGVSPDRITVLNNIVSPPAPVAEPSGNRPDNRLRVLYLGEISDRKGCFDLLRAIADDREYFASRIILRIGGNEVNGNIRQFIHDNRLEEFVTYEGWISGTKKEDMLHWQDTYILPSYNEGLPIAILEAMAHSRPVISTPVGGIPEIVESGVNGMLVTPGDRDAIASALRYYIDHPDKIRQHGDAGFRKVSGYMPEAVFSRLTEIYTDLLSVPHQ